jgi:hypothetical protein
MRAVYRSQASFLVALERSDPTEAALAGAMAIISFCEEHPEDAKLLVSFRREDLMLRAPEGTLAEELSELNEPIRRAVVDLARRLYGRRTRLALDRTLLAVFDLPYGAARRHLIAGSRLPAGLRADVARAVTAVIEESL